MPVMKGKSGLMAKYGNRVAKAHMEHKDDETTFGQMELPPIDNGIAQLVECKFSQYESGDNKGEFFFYAAGSVVEPRVAANGVPVFGQRTSIMEAMCDTPSKTRKTVEDHYAWVLNELRKLGVDTSAIGPEDLEATVAALKEAAPYFRFRSYIIPKKKPGDKGYNPTYDAPDAPPPRTNHQWNGQVDFSPDQMLAIPQDSTPSSNGDGDASGSAGTEADASGDQAGGTEGGVDIADLVAKAEAQDGEAQQQLTDLAMAAGADEDAIKKTNSWQEVADLISGATAPEDQATPEQEPEKPWEPVKSELHPYAPMILDAKTKKQSRAKKAIDCEVVAVDKKKRTMDLKNLDNPKIVYKGISWDDEGLTK